MDAFVAYHDIQIPAFQFRIRRSFRHIPSARCSRMRIVWMVTYSNVFVRTRPARVTKITHLVDEPGHR